MSNHNQRVLLEELLSDIPDLECTRELSEILYTMEETGIIDFGLDDHFLNMIHKAIILANDISQEDLDDIRM